MEYTPVKINKEYGIKYPTIAKRFKSPYAKARWGVEEKLFPDGSFRRFVPEDKIHLWKENNNYVGRPIHKKK